MIFMSQSGITELARESEWDRWYIEHLTVMATVPGVGSAQRFKTRTPGHSPSLAMYTIASAEVFSDPYYLSVRGMGEWLTLIDRRFYRRNLFDGLAGAPPIADGEILLITDRDAPVGSPGDPDWTWLECVGIDRSTPYRGITVVPESSAEGARDPRIAVYAPVTKRYGDA